MTRAVAILLALACCAVPTHDIPLGDEVDASDVDRAVDEIEACTGRACDLDGWSVWYAAEEDEHARFSCAKASQCGAAAPGAEMYDDGLCHCRGITRFSTMQVIVTADLGALKHELIHACYSVADHDGDLWECQ